MLKITPLIFLLLFSFADCPFADVSSNSEKTFNPDIPIELDPDHKLFQLFYSKEDNLDGFTIFIENVRELQEQGINEIYLQLHKSDTQPDMTPAIEYADTPRPDICLSNGRTIGQTFALKSDEIHGFYLPFGTYKKSYSTEISMEIYKLEQPIYGEFTLIGNTPKMPIGELCSKKYIDSKSITMKYKELLRSLMNKPPNYLHYSLGELFTSRYSNLCGIEVLLGTYNKKNQGILKFYIKERGVQKYISANEIKLEELENNKFKLFSFTPIPDSCGKEYYFFIESPDTFPDNAISGYTTKDDFLPDGKLYINHTLFDSDMVFRPIYSFGNTKAAEPPLPSLETPICTITLNPTDIKDNCFVFVDLSRFNLPIDSFYYMEVKAKNPAPSSPVTLYSTTKNIYFHGSRFVDRRAVGGDLLLIPVYAANHHDQRQIRTAVGKIEDENSDSITFHFPLIEKSMNMLYGFNLTTEPSKASKIKVKSKPINADDADYLYTGGYSTGRSLVFSPTYAKPNLLAFIAKLFNRFPIDKPAIFNKGYFIYLYLSLSLAAITIVMIIFLVFFKR